MNTALNIINDLIVICGNIIIFSTMLNFAKLKVYKKIVLSFFNIAMMVAYTLCVYLAKMPYIYGSILCFSIPSVIIYWIFSEIKDSRFFLSFCMVDTISLIVAFISKSFTARYENIAVYLTLGFNVLLYSLTIGFGFKLFKEYAELLKFQKVGWRVMMIASFIIYFALYFFAAYPIPLIERMEYVPTYYVFCIVVLVCYMVFFDSMIKSRKLHLQNEELEKEKKYHKIAYTDALTGLYNRAYYIDKINELERDREKYENICCVVFDINNFKDINDNMGHKMGDLILKDAALDIASSFENFSAFTFRTGGDEFVTLLMNVDKEEIEKRIEKLNEKFLNDVKENNVKLSVATGYYFINIEEDKISIENALDIADQHMYDDKRIFKENHPLKEF